MRQLILPVFLSPAATFENFYAGPNQHIVKYLHAPQEKFIFLTGVGKSHLLQAICQQKTTSLYLPFKQKSEFSPLILENLTQLDVVALDDIELIAGDTDWEQAIFYLYNQQYHQNKTLFIFSGAHSPRQMDFCLPDLTSRLQAVLQLNLQSLSDKDKQAALQQRAQQQGFLLSDKVAHYLLAHTDRDLTALFACLEKLDKLSLQEKRNLTIPFVKEVLCKN